MKKFVFFGIVFLIMFAVLFAFIKTRNFESSNNDKISVVSTLFPLYDFAKIIGGEYANVSMIIPPGIEPHSYEPKASDITTIMNSDIFLYTGDFMEFWVKDIVLGIDNSKTYISIASDGANFKEFEDFDNHEDEHEESHDHSAVDPHIWLDFENAQIISENIYNSFLIVDPENSDYYLENFSKLKEGISALDKRYELELKNCETLDLVYGGHFAFAYLANRYDLNYYSAQGFSPDSEPSAKELVDLIKLVKEKNVNTIFYEELTSPKISETLANEADLKMLLLNGAHNLKKDEFISGKSFISIMEENLLNLKEGLKCGNE